MSPLPLTEILAEHRPQRVRPVLPVLLVLAASLHGASAGAADWQPVGDSEAGFSRLEVLPGEPPVLLAVRDRELSRLGSPDGAWEQVPVPEPQAFTDDQGFDHIPSNIRIVGVQVSPRDPDWWLVTQAYQTRIEFEGNYATDFLSVRNLQTLDGGQSWSGWPGYGRPVDDFAFAPSLPGLVYMAWVIERRWDGSIGTLRVEPDGEVVTIIPPNGSGGVMRSLTVDAADPRHIYAHTDQRSLFVSLDGGETWVETAVPTPVGAVRAHPSIPGTALAALEDGGIWRTFDGGLTWHELAPVPAAGSYPTLALDPVDPGRYYVLSDGAAFASDDAGATWQALADGLPAGAVIWELEVDPGDPSRLFAVVEDHGIWQLDRRFPADPCVPDERTLCLGEGGRFAARVLWQDFASRAGSGHAVPLPADDSGAFWFFSPDNVELLVKALDGGPVNGFHWLFYGALTNVPFTLVVTDTETGETVGYYNPSRRFASRGDTTAFPEGRPDVAPPPGVATEPVESVVAPSPCAPGPTALCLADDRFRVEVEWQDFQGNTGVGTAVPATDDSGFFWFFRDGNLELTVKVLDGRAITGHWWVFYGALTNVAFDLRVTDTESGEVRTYRNPSGNFASRGDTRAFPD